MSENLIDSIVINGRTLKQVKKDICETAAWGYNQIEAQKWAKKEIDKATEKYRQKAVELQITQPKLTDSDLGKETI